MQNAAGYLSFCFQSINQSYKKEKQKSAENVFTSDAKSEKCLSDLWALLLTQVEGITPCIIVNFWQFSRIRILGNCWLKYRKFKCLRKQDTFKLLRNLKPNFKIMMEKYLISNFHFQFFITFNSVFLSDLFLVYFRKFTELCAFIASVWELAG